MPDRSSWSVRAEELAERTWVRCPSCTGPALAVRGEREPSRPRVVRVSCTGCGWSREWRTKGDGRPADDVVPASGEVCDLLTGLPLWLQTPCAGHVLWAFSAEHLDLLRTFVAATLRERATYAGWDGRPRTDTYYGRLPAALPGWLKSAKHRDEVLAGLDRLAARVPGGGPA